MRKALTYGGTAVAAVVIIVVVALASVDFIVKAAIERVGSDVTQTEVTVEEVEISLTSGEGTIRGLVIGHPEGFEERVMRIGEARIVLDIGSLTSDTIVIKEISVTVPEVTVEISGAGTNVSRLQENLAQAGGGGGSPSGGNPEDEKKLVIEHVVLADGRVDLKAAGIDRGVGANLPTITLTDIGKDSGGADPAEVAKVILAVVSAAAGQAAITSGVLQKLEGGVGDKAKGLLEKAPLA
jgi:uncharacterized protein involved in outer membrane biogenesis